MVYTCTYMCVLVGYVCISMEEEKVFGAWGQKQRQPDITLN